MSDAEIHQLSEHRRDTADEGPFLVNIYSHTMHVGPRETSSFPMCFFFDSGSKADVIDKIRSNDGYWAIDCGNEKVSIFVPWPPAAITFEPMTRKAAEERLAALRVINSSMPEHR